MQFRLGDIAQINSGQTIRGRVENDSNGTVGVIQMKDLNSSYSGLISLPYFIAEKAVSKKQILKKGDVMFLAKGNNNKAFVFNEDYPAVAVSLFFVVRTNKEMLLPEYLMWLLNNRETQVYLKSIRSTAAIANVKKQVLEDLLIELPSMEKQKLIAKVYQLGLKEDNLLLSLQEKTRVVNEEILMKLK